ncbi:MAG TPA: MFS transporter [Eoetvoesiella sp.]|uniref:MFS transporter n=1 Tax=Eoetvoesiella sp. TaxID=1966355 RepID=UPI002CCF0067|nr:MFS transporter [Eoetvoesiella sp.]HWK60132.1 MFS transporter [Eoetvoesiella sp.]
MASSIPRDNSRPVANRQFLLVACAGFASMAGMRLCDTLLPALARSFDAGVGDAAGAVSMFAIAYGVLQLVYGPLGDRYGKQRVICLAVAVSAFINLALTFSPSLSILTGLRFLAGAAAAGIVPLSMAHIGDSVPYAQRQQVLAKFLTATIMGMICGQWAGGILADTLGWRTGFVLLTLLFGAVATLMARRLPPVPGAAAQADRKGYGAQLMVVLRTPWARRILLAALIEGCVAYGAFVFIPVHLHERFGLSLTMAGGVVVLYGLGGLGYAMSARRIVARLGEPRMVLCGGALMATGFGVLAFAPSWTWSIPACALAGFGFYMMHNTLQANATQMAVQARGTAVSLFACSLFLGQSIGVGIVAQLLDSLGTSAAFIPGMVVLPLLGLWLAWSIRHRR